VYTGFGLAPRAGDAEVAADPEDIRRDRAALNDQVRRRENESDFDRENPELFALPPSS
jgi:hypothetical protein